ncbi:HD domain-containing protein [Myxococcota bacterium]|nr:HD domain-containing protein [Myxococcota bacterium]MBU1429607.1 HD domain-containing protein [Myxococcota bacterium]MBU1897413.1 HD domain-containing protein [Myxococcota bacterium]
MIPWRPESYIKALRFAGVAHAGQRYPGTEVCYLMHLSMVCMEILAALTVEPDLDGDLAVQCALLHDVIEDTPQTFEAVREAFGEAVARGVAALSKRPELSKAAAMADSLERIQAQPREVWMVKLADRACNLQAPPPYWSAAKRRAYRDEARRILDALGAASPTLAARLAARIEAYAAFITPDAEA